MNWFVNYIYREANAKLGTSFEPGQNPAVDSLATKIALQTGINNNLAPTTVLSFLNQGLGTNYTLADYNRAATEFGFTPAAEEPPPAAVTVEAPPPVTAAPETQVTAPIVTEEPAADTSTNLFSNIEANPFIESAPVKEAAGVEQPQVTQSFVTPPSKIKLPDNLEFFTPKEKAQTYNSLLDQGFSDAEILSAVEEKLGKQSPSDWQALKNIATDLLAPVAPTVTTTEEAPATTTTAEAAPAAGFKIQDYIKEATDFLNSPENLQLAEGAATMQQVTLPDGRTLNVYSDGLAQEFTSDGRVKVYNQSGEEVLSQTQEEYKRAGYLSPVVNALMAAAAGAVLGPAGTGLLSTPAAAAAATGGTTLVRGGSVEDALKAAALAGLTAGATEGLLGGGGGGTAVVDDFVAENVAKLAEQGISESQIAQILTQEGVSNKTINAALDATFGVSAPGSAKGLDFPATTTGAEQVPVTGAGTGLLSSGAAAPLGSGLSTLVDTTPAVTEQVPVTGQNLLQTKVTIDDLLSVLTSGVTGALPAVTGGETQQVGITEQKPQTTVQDVVPAVTAGITAGAPTTVPTSTAETQRVETTGKTEKPDTTTENIISSLVPAVVPTTVQPPATTSTSTADTQRVETTAKKDTSLLPTLGSAVTAVLPVIPAAVTAELPKVADTTTKTNEKSLFTPSDLLKLIGLLGGAGAGAALSGTGTGTGIGTLPPSDTMLGTTTPQFGPDYYAAVQRYYKAYMPQTPRDVATPLQQWYENKFGA